MDSLNDRLFIGVYPGGIVFSDREVEEHGDYRQLAFLPYHSLEPQYSEIIPVELRGRIEVIVKDFQDRKGQTFKTAVTGHSMVILGGNR